MNLTKNIGDGGSPASINMIILPNVFELIVNLSPKSVKLLSPLPICSLKTHKRVKLITM